MVYKVVPKSPHPLISYLDHCLHNEYEFEGKILLENQSEIIFTNKTRFKIYGEDYAYIELTNPDACIKISSIIGVVK